MEGEGGAIALLDALGIKGVLARSRPEQVAETWNYIVTMFEEACASTRESSDGLCTGCSVSAFSDTVIITLRGPHLDDLVMLLGPLIAFPFWEALVRGIYFRGVIATGLFYQSKTSVIGPAIDEAAAWYEQSDWIGVSASPSAALVIGAMPLRGKAVSEFFFRHPIPLKVPLHAPGFFGPGWGVAWPRAAVRLSGSPESAKANLMASFASGPITAPVIAKYANALAFFDAVVSN